MYTPIYVIQVGLLLRLRSQRNCDTYGQSALEETVLEHLKKLQSMLTTTTTTK